MRIVVLFPWTDPTGELVKTFRGLLAKEVDMTDIEVTAIDEMPEPVIYREGMSPAASALENLPLSIPGVMKKAKSLEKDGADAIVIACVLGPGSAQAMQVVDIPVLDPGEVAMHVAAMLGHKFTILVPGATIRGFQENVQKYGLASKLASILSTDIDPASYAIKERETMDVLLRLSLKSIEEDEAAVIVLGCGMLTGGIGKELNRLLKEKGHDVTVIQPVPLAVEVAKVLVKLNLKQVRLVPADYQCQF